MRIKILSRAKHTIKYILMSASPKLYINAQKVSEKVVLSIRI